MANLGYGALTPSDSIAAVRYRDGETVLEYQGGESALYELVDARMRAANQQAGYLISRYCAFTNQRATRLPGVDGSVEVDELTSSGRSQGEHIGGGFTVGLPLRKFGKALAWNYDAFQMLTVEEFMADVNAIVRADKKNIIYRIRRAIYLPYSYNFYDFLLDNALVKVKPLANGDSDGLPMGPNETSFPQNHTHYLARAGVTPVPDDVRRLINTVNEHWENGTLRLTIHRNQRGLFQSWKDIGFTPTLVVNVVPGQNAVYDPRTRINPMAPQEELIGNFDGVDVYVHYMAIDGYIECDIQGDGIPKPVAVRVRGKGKDGAGGSLNLITRNPGGDGTGAYGFGDLKLVFDNEDYPLRAREWHREFDAGGWGRVSMAILYIGGTTYTEPSIDQLKR